MIHGKKRGLAALATGCLVASSFMSPALAKPDKDDVTPQEAQQSRRQFEKEAEANPQITQPDGGSQLDKSRFRALSVTGVTQTAYGAELALGNYVGTVRFITADTVKFSVRTAGEKEFASAAVVDKDRPAVPLKFKETGQSITLTSSSVTVTISKKKYGVKVVDNATGHVITEDYLNYGSGYQDGKPYAFKKTSPGEAFYGFGEQTKGLNKRGDSIGMWNTDSYAYSPTAKYIYSSIPFFMGLKDNKAYGVFFDNTHHSHYEMANESEDYYYFYAEGGDLTYYVFNGPKISDVVARYTELTGRYQQPPEWSLGWEQSHWGYSPSSKIVEVAKGYRDRGIPLDAMNVDIDYMDGWRLFTWGEQFGDPDEMDAKLEAMGVKTITINDPGVKKDPNYSVWREGTEKGYWATNPDGSDYDGAVWAGASNFPDFTRPEVRDWFADKYDALLNHGVEGIWLDMNEPAVFDGPDHTMPLDIEFDNGKLQHTEVHNLYGFWNTVSTHKAFEKFKPGERPFIFSRDMYAGSQRYAALWSGDNVSSWEHLAMTIPLNSNVGLSGVPHVGNDIGGFVSDTTPELFARWMQVGAFIPFARVHYDNAFKPDQQCQEPWCLGAETEAIGKEYIRLRYKLLPYLYNAFRQARETGAPVQQPLVYQYQDDAEVTNIQDQFMFGKEIMVAPVVTKGQTSRRVYLPKGSRWTDWWDGKSYDGGQWITREAPLNTMPIFVKSDSIVPTREVQMHTGQNPLTKLDLNTWVGNGETATTVFYEDDGKSKKYESGEFDETRLTIARTAGEIRFTSEVLKNGYDSKLGEWNLVLHNLSSKPTVTSSNGGQPTVTSYDAETGTATVSVPLSATDVRLGF